MEKKLIAFNLAYPNDTYIVLLTIYGNPQFARYQVGNEFHIEQRMQLIREMQDRAIEMLSEKSGYLSLDKGRLSLCVPVKDSRSKERYVRFDEPGKDIEERIPGMEALNRHLDSYKECKSFPIPIHVEYDNDAFPLLKKKPTMSSVTFDLGCIIPEHSPVPYSEDLETISFEEGNYMELLNKLRNVSAKRFIECRDLSDIEFRIPVLTGGETDKSTCFVLIENPKVLREQLKRLDTSKPIPLNIRNLHKPTIDEIECNDDNPPKNVVVAFNYQQGLYREMMPYKTFSLFKKSLYSTFKKSWLYNPGEEVEFYVYPVYRTAKSENDLEPINPVLVEHHVSMCRQCDHDIQIHVKPRTWGTFRSIANSPSFKGACEAIKTLREEEKKVRKASKGVPGKKPLSKHKPADEAILPKKVEGIDHPLINIEIRVEGNHLINYTIPEECSKKMSASVMLFQRARDCLLAKPKDIVKVYNGQLGKFIVYHDDYIEALSKGYLRNEDGTKVLRFDCTVDNTPLGKHQITLDICGNHSESWDWPLDEKFPCVTHSSLETEALEHYSHINADSPEYNYGVLIIHSSSGRKVPDQKTFEFILKREVKRRTKDIRFSAHYYSF
jgi:hypothetical protein